MAMVRLEGLDGLKTPVTSMGIEPVTYPLNPQVPRFELYG
jgi:hypothetical protein